MPLVVTPSRNRAGCQALAQAQKATHLKQLALSEASIGRALGVTPKTVGKAIAWFREMHGAERALRTHISLSPPRRFVLT